MTLFHCIDYANICGLETLNEALNMTEHLSPSLFSYGSQKEEFRELYNDIAELKISDLNMNLIDVLNIINTKRNLNYQFTEMVVKV